MNQLTVRILSSIVLGIVLLGSLLVNEWFYLLPFSLLALRLGLEYIRLQMIDTASLQWTTGATLLLTFLLMYIAVMTYRNESIRLLVPLFCIVFNLLWIVNLYRPGLSALYGPSYVIKSFMYIGLNLSCLHFILHPDGEYNYTWFVLVVVAVWLTDIFAFLTGSLIGKSKLFKSVSPRKTWEGFFGGLIIPVIIYVILALLLDLHLWLMILISLSVSVSSVYGDLVASKLKRSAGMKDSGRAIPGHGGALDRFDGFLFAMPSAALVLELIKLL